ncbi:MAG: NAD+ synthetase, partial [Thermoguttaceae bacterium]|nr:NAD+ synthetase [Thermoguttaceae bacterium]
MVSAGIDADDATFVSWAVKFCRFWTRNQWKRERYAPGFALDEYNLFPSDWTRYPSLSAGFESEIEELLKD